MRKPKDVYYISGSTSLLAKDLGKALLSQFPGLKFREESIPFVQDEKEAERAYRKIMNQSGGTYPIVISSLFSKKLNSYFNTEDIYLLTVFDQFLQSLENHLGIKAMRRPGKGRRQDDITLRNRVSAIHFSIAHDDGLGLGDYDEAELIIVGVSRCGKTPVSVFLATQLGVKTANYPLIEKDLSSCHLPSEIRRNKHKVISLSMEPETLMRFREHRFPASDYASLKRCRKEIDQSNKLFQKYGIPAVHAGGSSIEETSIQVMKKFQQSTEQPFENRESTENKNHNVRQ